MPRNRSRVADIFTLPAHNHTARAFKAHIRNSPAPPVLLYIITLRCFLSHFLLFLFLFGRSCGRQNSSSGSIYRNTSPLPARPDKPVRLPSSHASSLRYAASFRLRALFASCSRAFRQVRGSFCHRTAVRRPPRLFRLPLFPQAVQGSAFLYVLVSCGTYVLSFAKTSTFIEVFARLCIFIHCVIACFSPIRLLFPSLRSFSRCRSEADDRASAPLRRFCFRAPHRRPGLPFSSALVCIPFFRGSASLFLISLSLFASCPMAHRKLLFVFLLLRLFALPFEDPLRIFARL